MEVVREMFPEHVISLCGDLSWPARSPDLSTCDYFLCDYLNMKVYTTRPRTFDDIKVKIRKQISAIPQTTTKHGEASSGKSASQVGTVRMQ
jgi:hypothetical protein